MSLQADTYSRGRVVNILTACPACGYDFSRDERRFKHLGEHDPTDFGLSPLGEKASAAEKPLFGGDGR